MKIDPARALATYDLISQIHCFVPADHLLITVDGVSSIVHSDEINEVETQPTAGRDQAVQLFFDDALDLTPDDLIGADVTADADFFEGCLADGRRIRIEAADFMADCETLVGVPAQGPAVGHSLTSCIRAIVRGAISIDDVARIETSAAFADRVQLEDTIRSTMMGRDVEQCVAIATHLHSSGRIVRRKGLADVIDEQGLWRLAKAA